MNVTWRNIYEPWANQWEAAGPGRGFLDDIPKEMTFGGVLKSGQDLVRER